MVTDAWAPQVNGVVRTLRTVVGELRTLGHEVEVLSPDLFRSVPCPTYPEIRLACWPRRQIARAWERFQPQAVHLPTEGPLGLSARSLCLERKVPFTSAFHTRFPEYIQARTHVPARWTYRAMRWFHAPAARVMVATRSLENELSARGFSNVALWSRGVDTALFFPRGKDALTLPRPIALYVGRVAVEKNIQAFMDMPWSGSKVVVGDGPLLAALRVREPSVHFLGAKHGEELARLYSAADVFVFPSLTDTFGLVLLEALASGVPVAAFAVPGPLDVIGDAPVGRLGPDLAANARAALEIDPKLCRTFAERHSWRSCAELFLRHLAPFSNAARAGIQGSEGHAA